MTEADRKEFKELITDGFKSQREWLEATINPIQKDIDKHKDIVEEFPVIKQKLDSHIENHTSENNRKRFNYEMWIIVGIFILDKISEYFPPGV